jgi:predicted small integral membrane protein
MSLEWMAWTWPTALFFTAVALMLLTMTALQLVWPTAERRGFIPLSTTRGDRLFIALLSAAFIHLAWLGLSDEPLWYASILALLWGAVVLRWG